MGRLDGGCGLRISCGSSLLPDESDIPTSISCGSGWRGCGSDWGGGGGGGVKLSKLVAVGGGLKNVYPFYIMYN